MSRRYIQKNPSRPFSDAVLIDDTTLYLSGRIGLLPSKLQVPDTAEEEARLVLNDVKNVLALAGMTMDHLVSLQVFCSDVSLWETFNAIYRTYFAGPLPPRAFLGSGTLLFNARFELMGIAVKDA